jgi:hypothetical protein
LTTTSWPPAEGTAIFAVPLADREKTRTRIVLRKNEGISPDRFFDNAGHQAIDMIRVELAKKVMTRARRAFQLHVGALGPDRHVILADTPASMNIIEGLDHQAAAVRR